ncbi:S ribosomal protein S11%2C mitochondrial [Xyrichtys novacula]|uniref:S ribosomal protein S11, mitochondrial n=1 Tax=Xyrichtys novacula TaxID=13765 RepID=A0AAV1EJ01_XYRNO|nr:S ribosomal protein S11%2C mitochondrial [Xyrichtys novacula]
MYKLNSISVSSLSNVCRQLAASLQTNSSSLCGSSGLKRTLCSSTVKLQEAAAAPTPASGSEKTSREFSHFPPIPGQDSPLRWAGKKFEELPIIHVKATYNNTHIQLTDSAGQSLVRTSCGTEGFKNVKKSTPIAAQTAGISAAASAIKGLTIGGLQVVSITDNTPVPHNGCRPRKARRT